MARRLIYSPAEMMQASTPFYENLVGTITDQADRIARNIQKKEEAAQIAEERQFQMGMQEQRLDAQQQMQDDSQEFQASENLKDRKQGAEEFGQLMDYRWATLENKKRQELIAQSQKAQEQFQEQADEYQKRVNKMYDKLKKGGWRSTDEPEMYHIGYDENNEAFTVIDKRNAQAQPFEQWVAEREPLLGIQDALAGGSNVMEWADNKLYDADEDFGGLSHMNDGEVMEDTVVDGEGNIYVGRDAVRTAIAQVRDGLDHNGKSRELLTRLADNDSKYRPLEKEDDLTNFDKQKVSATVGSIRGSLRNLDNFYGNLIDAEEKTLTETDEEQFKMMYPNPVEFSTKLFSGNEDMTLPGKSIAELRRSQHLLKQKYGSTQMDTGVPMLQSSQYEGIENAISNLEDLAVQTIAEYKNAKNVEGKTVGIGIPEELKDKSITFLSRVARVNEEEFNKDNPNPANLFVFPSSGSDEAKELAEMDEQDLMNRYTEEQLRERQSEQNYIEKIIGNPEIPLRGY